jgi:hypothetical protein
MHCLDVVGCRAALRQERLQRGRDRYQQRENVTQWDLIGRLYAVGPVLTAPGMAYADLMLIVKPGLIELSAGVVENPTAEPASYGG